MSEVRLIDANALRTRINNVPMHGDTDVFYEIMSELVSVVASAPTEDAEIVRHGRWSSVNEYCNHADQFSCSACNGLVFYNYYTRSCDYEYCTHCGAKMDAEVPNG